MSGESHYFQGTRYLLNVIETSGPDQVKIRNKQFIDLFVRAGSQAEPRQRVLTDWYRAALRDEIPPLIEKWEKTLGVGVKEWGIKQMKTRWGSCNIGAQRIWFNLELVKKSKCCLEYVVVHEMMHLLERHHNERFRALMSQYLPQWQLIRDELNHELLAHEEWEY